MAGRYRLDSIIGSGGVGRVWRGEDTVLRRAVAIKEVPLPVHLPDDEREALRARVLREAQAAARIHHPGSVQVFDVIDSQDTVHLVMELVEDLTLAEVVDKDGPLDPRATAAMGAELLGALEAAHAVGIVHRDVKPRNVMVLPSGGVKLADFGIASLRDDPSITKTGMVLGTPSYMSPEQALGEPVGPATDVWGTGALLYYAVEGVPPFDRGETIATLHAVVHGEPRPYERAGPLAPLLDRFLAKDPDDRISLGDARARLQSVAEGDAGAGDAGAAAGGAAAVADAGGVDTGGSAGTTTVPAADATSVAPAATTAVAPGPARHERSAPPRPPPPPMPTRRTGSSPTRALPYVAVGAVLAVLVVGGIVLAAQDDGGGTAVTDATDTAPTTEPDGGAATSAPPVTEAPDGDGDGDGDEGTETTSGPDGDAPPEGVPASWTPFTEPSIGWTIWHPADWQPVADGATVDIRDPASGSYLRVDHTDAPGDDPVAAWEESSARFADRYPDYEELRIEATKYQGFDAAVWEYTYQGQRATNLGFITPDRGFALNFQTPASQWEELQDLRSAFEASFTAPG